MATLPPSSHIGHGAGPVSLDNILELGRYFIQSLIPRKTLKATPNPFERKFQPFWVILKVRDACALPPNIPLRTGIILVTSDLHDLTAFCDYLQAAVLATQYTRSFLPFAHDPLHFTGSIYLPSSSRSSTLSSMAIWPQPPHCTPTSKQPALLNR